MMGKKSLFMKELPSGVEENQMSWTLIGLLVACAGWTISILKGAERAFKLKVTEQNLADAHRIIDKFHEDLRREGEEWKDMIDEEDQA